MKRCSVYGKIVWFWQRKYIGSGAAAHAECDLRVFSESVRSLVDESGGKMGFTQAWADDQIRLRKLSAYS
jgi:hypothetical protein